MNQRVEGDEEADMEGDEEGTQNDRDQSSSTHNRKQVLTAPWIETVCLARS